MCMDECASIQRDVGARDGTRSPLPTEANVKYGFLVVAEGGGMNCQHAALVPSPSRRCKGLPMSPCGKPMYASNPSKWTRDYTSRSRPRVARGGTHTAPTGAVRRLPLLACSARYPTCLVHHSPTQMCRVSRASCHASSSARPGAARPPDRAPSLLMSCEDAFSHARVWQR